LVTISAICSVDRAGLISDVVLLDPDVHVVGIATVAAHACRARNHHLGGYVDVGPGCVTVDLDAIRQRGGSSLGPAGTAVSRDVLVLNCGQIVGRIDVVPDPLLGKIISVNEGRLDKGSSAVFVTHRAGHVGVHVLVLSGDGSGGQKAS
jgi:hypothetical protein